MSSAEQKAQKIKMLVLDVDGVLTDGRIYYGNDGEEIKAFNIKDGLGMTVVDACAAVRAAADWQSQLPGGSGAVREACEFILKARSELSRLVAEFG